MTKIQHVVKNIPLSSLKTSLWIFFLSYKYISVERRKHGEGTLRWQHTSPKGQGIVAGN